jgi:8-oxo-dGTP pyrophosphatase MutT (NUDIX family)
VQMILDFEKLAERLTQPLPGAPAHEVARAEAIGNLRPTFEHTLPPRPGSVLILLYHDGARIRFPLTKRPDYLGAHGGQVSLPGGKAEGNETLVETALREAEEEIGINRKDVHVLGKLSDFFVIPSNFMVTPIVASAGKRPRFVPQEREVVKILEGDVEELLREDALKTKSITVSKIYNLNAPHFEIDGETVWGATAMMLNEFRMVVRDVTGTQISNF